MTAFQRFKRFVRGHIVFFVALCAALLALPFAQGSVNYLEYIDAKTIACLFCILAVVGMLSNAGMFEAVARLFGRAFPSVRRAICALVGTTMLLSMFVTNDMALVAMLPLAAAVLNHSGQMQALPFCFIMQNLAANLGGMILPFGNPQNLFLFSYYTISLWDFLETMALPFAMSVMLIGICCIAVPNRISASSPATTSPDLASTAKPAAMRLDRRSFAIGVALFAVTVLAVFRVVPYLLAVVVVLAALLFFDRKALKSVDWFLLMTFVCFFEFAGIVSHIPVVNDVLTGWMSSEPLLTAAAASQVISNVPASVLLSQVTDAWQPLLVGVNIGGAGTMVASLASLITIERFGTLRIIARKNGVSLCSERRFTAMLMGYGFAFLLVLCVACRLVMPI